MAINFDELPDSGRAEAKPGWYLATVLTATIKESKTSKANYLELKCQFYNEVTREKSITFYDRFYESSAPALGYKLHRINTVAGLNITGTLELKDLGKLLIGKSYLIKTKKQIDAATKKETGYLEVDIFDSEIYKPVDSMPFDVEEEAPEEDY